MDTESLLRLLNGNRVRFVIIGAMAFPVHGYSRTTLDIDLFIYKTKTNAQRTLKALKEFGYDVTGLTVKDLITKKVLLRQYLVEADIHPFVKGIRFETVWHNRVKGRIGSTMVYFANLNDLIKMKQASNRPQDKEDLRILLKLREKKK